MQLTSLLLVVGLLQVSAKSFSQNRITLSVNDQPLKQVFKELRLQSGYDFVYSSRVLKRLKNVSLHLKDASLDEAMMQCLKGQPLAYTILDKTIVISLKDNSISSATLQMPDTVIHVRGRVVDETGQPLSGVSVVLQGTTTGTMTDDGGRYTLILSEDEGTLVYSSIGYVKKEMPVKGKVLINVTLDKATSSLDQLVVVGYGTQKKGDLTGAITSISSKDFDQQPVTRLDEAMAGRAPGVQVTRTAGAPGGAVRIRIRGDNSLTGSNEPLYVIDGLVGADFTDINANDIANIEILKDASATAIYGSRGANGVVIITTKSGQKGTMKVDFMTRISSARVIKRYPIMDAADFAEVVNARGLALAADPSAYVPRFSDDQIASYRKNGGTDWQDEIFRPALGQEYQLGLSGGNENTTFRVSANYLNQKGVIDNSDYKRYSISSSLNTDFSDKFSFRFRFAGTRNEYHNTSGTGARGGSLGQALAWAPTTQVRDSQGNFIIKDPTSSIFQNPVALNEETDNRNNRTNLNLIGGLRYEFVPGLSLDAQLGIDYTNLENKGYIGPDISGNTPSASRSSNENILLQNTENLTFDRVFGDVHHLKITAVFETQKFIGSGFNVSVNDLTYPSLSYNNIALSASSNVGSGYSDWSLLSLLGRVDYSYKDKYLVTANLRRDGSSKFQGKNKYSVFPSAAVGWKLSKEPFIRDMGIFSDLKIRASWGMTGNQGIGSYGTLSSYVSNIDDAGAVFEANGTIVPGVILGNPGNPALKWETTEQTDAGADISLLKGRLNVTVDYFIKNTRDLLLSEPVPGYLGGYSKLSNVGKMQNKGWEFAVSMNVLDIGQFNWTSSANLSLLKNKLVSLGEGTPSIILGQFILQPGYPIGSFYLNKYLGTWKPGEADQASLYGAKPGDAHYEDVNGDGVIDTKDYTITGNSVPKATIGWNNTFSYRHFSLNIFLQGMLGYDKLNYSYAFGMLASTDAKEVLFSDIKNRYIPGINETSNIPAFSGTPTNAIIQSSRFLDPAGFLRLKNIGLSYNFPHTVLKKIQDLNLFVDVTNLFTITHYRGIDPEANSNATGGLGSGGINVDAQSGTDQGAYPNAVVFTAGLKINF